MIVQMKRYAKNCKMCDKKYLQENHNIKNIRALNTILRPIIEKLTLKKQLVCSASKTELKKHLKSHKELDEADRERVLLEAKQAGVSFPGDSDPYELQKFKNLINDYIDDRDPIFYANNKSAKSIEASRKKDIQTLNLLAKEYTQVTKESPHIMLKSFSKEMSDDSFEILEKKQIQCGRVFLAHLKKTRRPNTCRTYHQKMKKLVRFIVRRPAPRFMAWFDREETALKKVCESKSRDKFSVEFLRMV